MRANRGEQSAVIGGIIITYSLPTGKENYLVYDIHYHM